MTAFVLGNGVSRNGIDLHNLKHYGKIYGCNALYREFNPDVLVSTDPAISREIQESGWPKGRRHYTRKPFSDSGSLKLHPDYKGMSSGPNALNIACSDGHETIYLLGFDLGSVNQRIFNNVYADTPCYKSSTASATFGGNWMNQITRIMNENKKINFIRVVDENSATFRNLDQVKNYKEIPKTQFLIIHK